MADNWGRVLECKNIQEDQWYQYFILIWFWFWDVNNMEHQ